jgi:hypothetical protein
MLAGISLRWYTWLEQAKDVNFSADVLDRVSRALRLSSAEREYLLCLMRKDPAPPTAPEADVTETVRRTVQFVPVPALAMTLRWDVVAWNSLSKRVFRDYGAIAPTKRNLLRIILTDTKAQSRPDGYDVIARKLLAEFRVDFSRHASDPSFEQLIAELKQTAPRFQRHWSEIEVSDSPRGSLVQHDQFGDLSFDRISYLPEGSQFLRVLMFTPRDLKTARIVDAMRAQDAGAFQERRTRIVDDTDALRLANRH